MEFLIRSRNLSGLMMQMTLLLPIQSSFSTTEVPYNSEVSNGAGLIQANDTTKEVMHVQTIYNLHFVLPTDLCTSWLKF